MINLEDVTGENIQEQNPDWLQIPDHSYRILVAGGSGSGKTNALLDLISHQTHIDKIFLYAKDPYEPKFRFFINKYEGAGLKLIKPIGFTAILNDTIQESKEIY